MTPAQTAETSETSKTSQAEDACTFTADCRTRAAADRLSNKWVGLVVFCLKDRSHHFGEMRRRIDGISQKVLTETLRLLERDGLVARAPEVAGRTTAIRYSLTPLGESFAEPLTAFYGWLELHAPEMDAGHKDYDTRKNGKRAAS